MGGPRAACHCSARQSPYPEKCPQERKHLHATGEAQCGRGLRLSVMPRCTRGPRRRCLFGLGRCAAEWARLALIVDDAVHAQGAQALRLGLAARGGHHAAARQQRQLRAKVARAARGGRDKGCLALTQRAARDLHAGAILRQAPHMAALGFCWGLCIMSCISQGCGCLTSSARSNDRRGPDTHRTTRFARKSLRFVQGFRKDIRTDEASICCVKQQPIGNPVHAGRGPPQVQRLQ